jgi:predicted aspartyl protease
MSWYAQICLFLVAAKVVAAEPLAKFPITFSRERVMVPVSLNGSNYLSFLLDSGYSLTMVRPELAEALQLKRGRDITIIGIAGQERAATYEGAVLDIGKARYEPRRIAALPSENTRRRRDGILGSGLFRAFVIEIDFTAKQLALYAPTNFNYAGRGEIVPLSFRRGSTAPVIDATIPGTNGAIIRGQFEIDTGCDSSVCLGHDFAKEHRLLDETATRDSEKFGVGGGTRTRSGHLPQLRMGAATVEKPQTDFFLEGSPVDPGLAGHIGITALNRFKVIFDYSRKQMILEPR